MKKYGLVFFAFVFFVVFLSIARWYPDYDLKFEGQDYAKEDLGFALEEVSRTYDFLMQKICSLEDCSLPYAREDFGDVGEEDYYFHLPEDISVLKEETAYRQFHFALLKTKSIVINQNLELKNELKTKSPWIGSESGRWWIVIRYGLNDPFSSKIPSLIKRLVRDYSSLRIYLKPQVVKASNEKYLSCLSKKKNFWDRLNQGALQQMNPCLQNDYTLLDQSTVIPFEIYDMTGIKLNYEGYLPFIKLLEPTYLYTKFSQ